MSLPSLPLVSPSPRPPSVVAARGALRLVSAAAVASLVTLPIAALARAPLSGVGSAKSTPASRKKAASPKPVAKITPSPRAALKPTVVKGVAVASSKPVAPSLKAGPRPVATHWESAYVEVLRDGRGRINYEAGIAKAVGLGAIAPPSLGRSQAQRVLDARAAALADALRTLSIAVSEVRVTADTRARNYILNSDDVRVAVRGVINSAEVIEEKLVPGTGLFRVVVQVPLSGEGSLAQALGLERPKEERIAVVVPEPEPKPDPYAPGAPAPNGAEYTSLIVDCRGLGVEACMSPRLMDEDGREVYGKVMVSPDYAIETGIVAFPRSLDEAMNNRRAGYRPLIVRARGVADRNRFNPYISERDARRIVDANRDSRFFERTAVIFLVDPVRYSRHR